MRKVLILCISLYGAVHRGCVCEAEGYTRWNIFDQSMQDWLEEYLPWSGLLMGLIGVIIGLTITWLALALFHPLPV